MTNKETAQRKISELVERFSEQIESYNRPDYNETQTRRDFIDPFFKALGWDIDNENGYAESYREVIHEDRLRVGNSNKAPDYSFRLVGGKRLFFVEAKKPSVSVKDEIPPAYQIRRYGWSAKMPVSIITDFQEFAVYDCTKKPKPTDKASVARVKYLSFKGYLTEFDFLWETFSKEQVLKGSFDKFIKSDTHKKGTATVDKEFLQSLDSWRTYLATSISWNNKELDEDEINFVVQQTIDRIIFLRIAEDRGVEHYGNLKTALKQGDLYQNLFHLFENADDKYNSGLFDFKKDRLSKNLKVDNKIIKNIINELYYPECPYEFAVLPVEILGSAYEQFLGKQIRVDKAHRARIEEKPEVRKAGGVYYTPQYIVDYIVKNTVGKLVEGKTPKEVSQIKIVDPACGSGSFLIGAYQFLLDWHKDFYTGNGKPSKGKKDNPLTPDGNLTTAEKKRILLNNIYGVDIDMNAVEVTKLSLLLKCMEGETQASIDSQLKMFNERVLPTLDNNIKSGNSLIDTDFYDTQLDFGDEKKIKPFNWQMGFPEVFKQGGFDVVIGNPPYVMTELEETQKTYFSTKYKFQEGKPDLYRLFTEKSQQLLKQAGIFSFIIPNSILTIPACKKLRKYLLTEGGLIEVINFYGQVFENVSINNIILTTKKQTKGKYFVIANDKSTRPDEHSLNISKQNEIKVLKSDILEKEDFQIHFIENNTSLNLINKLKNTSNTLSSVSVYTLGMQVYHNTMHKPEEIKKRIYHSEIKKNKTYFPECGGTNVSKYFFNSNFKQFVSYGEWCYNRPDWEFCSEERIFIREIPDKSNLVCSLTNETCIPNKAVIIVIAKQISNQLLLGILNSKLIGYFTFNSTEKGKQRLFPRISLTTVKNLPIPKLSKSNIHLTQAIEESVTKLIELKQKKVGMKLQTEIELVDSRICHYDNQINELVYKLYELTPEEIKIVEST